jgi:hypothetical protein
MGYGYGVWLVYDNNDIINKGLHTQHIGHVTIACFMEKKEAYALYRDIEEKMGTNAEIDIYGTPAYYCSSYYEHDTNKLCAWGYNGKCEEWSLYKNICDNYKCDFSDVPHISKEYNLHTKLLNPFKIENTRIKCRLYCADIRSDFPVDWKLLTTGVIEAEL